LIKSFVEFLLVVMLFFIALALMSSCALGADVSIYDSVSKKDSVVVEAECDSGVNHRLLVKKTHINKNPDAIAAWVLSVCKE